MTDIEKINIVVDEISKAYNLSPQINLLIKNNIISRCNEYKDVQIKPNSNELCFIKDTNNLCDILLSRLINNVRNYNFDYSISNGSKGNYQAQRQQLNIMSYQNLETVISEKLSRRIQNIDKNIINNAAKKVFYHEFGHALQTSSSGINAENKGKVTEIINNLSTKYPNIFNNISNIPQNEFEIINQGMTVKSSNNIPSKSRSFYSGISYEEWIDEIFNEDESLELIGKKQQLEYDMGNGYVRNIYNYDSSNYKITNYAKMMKIIMGKEKTLNSMYNDPLITYEFFDQYLEEFNQSFKNPKYNIPMLNIMNSINEVRTNNSIKDALELDLFFTKCYEKQLTEKLNHELSNEQINEIEKELNEFKNQMLNNKNKNLNLEQHNIINNLQNKILQKKNNIQNTNSNEINHPQAIILNEVEAKIKEAQKIGDINLINNYKEQMKNIVRNNPFTIQQDKWNSLSFEQKERFYLIKMKEAKILDNIDDYQYYNANLNKLREKNKVEDNKKNITEVKVTNQNNFEQQKKDSSIKSIRIESPYLDTKLLENINNKELKHKLYDIQFALAFLELNKKVDLEKSLYVALNECKNANDYKEIEDFFAKISKVGEIGEIFSELSKAHIQNHKNGIQQISNLKISYENEFNKIKNNYINLMNSKTKEYDDLSYFIKQYKNLLYEIERNKNKISAEEYKNIIFKIREEITKINQFEIGAEESIKRF